MRELVPAATAPLTRQGHRQAGHALLAAADGRARDGPRQRRDLARDCRCSTTSATRRATSVPCCSSRSTPTSPASSASPTRRATGRGSRTWSPTSSSTVTVHDGFDFWVADVEDKDELAAALEQANAAAQPDRAPDPGRGGVLDRRRHQGAPALGDARARGRSCSTRWPGCTSPARTSSSTAPGWSGCSARTACWRRCGTCPLGTGPEALEDPASTFAEDLAAALADDSDLDRRPAGRPLRPREPAGHDPLTDVASSGRKKPEDAVAARPRAISHSETCNRYPGTGSIMATWSTRSC